MIRTVTASEARNDLSELVTWANSGSGSVVINNHGKPTAAIVSYDDFKILQEQKYQVAKWKFGLGLQYLRRAMQSNMLPEDSDEESFRQAGFSEETIRNLLDGKMSQREVRDVDAESV